MARARLILAWAAFAAWVAWLGWQAHTRGRFPVVSRLQFLATDLAVSATVSVESDGRPLPKVKVNSVVWPAAGNELAGQELELVNLPGCIGIRGAGDYILPLKRVREGVYRIADLPKTPLGKSGEKPHVYLDLPVVREQLKEIAVP